MRTKKNNLKKEYLWTFRTENGDFLGLFVAFCGLLEHIARYYMYNVAFLMSCCVLNSVFLTGTPQKFGPKRM